ncbi:MAG: hypothetical protein WC379_17045 [Methanoregula sp.]|jgi:hypothetical protein
MGKFEGLLSAIDPITTAVKGLTCLTYNVSDGTYDIYIAQYRSDGWMGFIFHQEKDKTAGLYFYLWPYLPFIKGREEHVARKEMIFLSGRDVLGLLGIAYPSPSNNFLDDVTRLSSIMSMQSARLIDAFSGENIEKTYNNLITCDCGKYEEIRDASYHFFAQYFAEMKVK